jgi:cytochrome P450 family 710 subfamily A protein
VQGRFLLFVNDDVKTIRAVYEKCSNDLQLALHPNAHVLLGKQNLAFMNGPPHKSLRSRFLPLFTPRALSGYLTLQRDMIERHLSRWFDESKRLSSPFTVAATPKAALKDVGGSVGTEGGLLMRPRIFELNIDTSLNVFIGAYLTPSLHTQLAEQFRRLTRGFLAFPVQLPGSDLSKGVAAREIIITLLSQVVRSAKQRALKNAAESNCLLDIWIRQLISEQANVKKGTPLLHMACEWCAHLCCAAKNQMR